MAIFEVLFNITYLIIIWRYLFKMYRCERTITSQFYFLAFLNLAIGDTFHVGLRSVAHLLGDINMTIQNIKLIGIGALATAITVTLTYWFFMKSVHHDHPNKRSLRAMAIVVGIRLFLIVLPQNQWFSSATYEWTLIRNIPLIIIGIILIVAMFKIKDDFYKKFAWLIILSYGFYVPVILWVKFIPMMGMLMIPKTIVYLLMLRHVYQQFFLSTKPK